MWFFIISAYVLSFVTFIMLIILMMHNYLPFPFLKVFPQTTLLVLTSVLYFVTETLVILCFFRKRSSSIKNKIYPMTLLNLLLMIVLFILPGAIRMGMIPWLVYQYYFVFCLWYYVYTKIAQHHASQNNIVNL